MPSVSTILKSLALATLLNMATGTPIAAAPKLDCKPVTKPSAPAPTVPASGDTPDLPTTALALQYVAIGRGIQNYTCAAAGANSSSTGAIATLFDATTLAYADINTLHSIPPVAVGMALPSGSFSSGSHSFAVLGNHFFDAAGTPTFNLSAVSKILFAGKTGDVKAPSTASKGPSGTGAVDWLQLTAKPAPYVSAGLSVAYRVVTAGGVAPACTAAGTLSVQYAAEYWFYM